MFRRFRLPALFRRLWLPALAGRALESGFSLIETLIALGLVTGAVIALAHLFALSTSSNLDSKSMTYAAVLAQQKVEELRALAFGFGADGLSVTDIESDTASDATTGGTGLSPSPMGALGQNTPGYVDHLDGSGSKLGGGVAPPGGAMYTRRWSIEPLPADPARAIVIQVNVTRHGRVVAASTRPGDVRLVTVRTRKPV
jgi:type II secretory pathway pseudopilin PulG